MYESYFKFAARPFLATPDVRRYVATTVIEEGRRSLARAIERGEGPGLIIGAPGTGKTLLCQLLAEEMDDRFAVAMLASGRIMRRRELLQVIAHELELPYRGMEEGELRLSLMDVLAANSDQSDGMLLIVDEAHTLNIRLLEEIRLLTNLVRNGAPRVRVILSGSALLEERFASPKLSSFSQRLAARVYLDSLSSSETIEYVQAQIINVGGDPARVFDEDALRAVHRASDGTPRLINQVCDHALLLAALAGKRLLTAAIIDEAWADLQRLPSPWSKPESSAHPQQVIEFGGLDERGDEDVAAIPFPGQATLLQGCALDEGELVSYPLGASSAEIDPDSHSLIPGGTEVELDFPEFGDPFSEQFEEEEVVLDRYGCDAELFDALPRVTCSESRQLAGLLKAWTSTAGLMISAAPSRVAAGVEIVGQRPVAMLATAPTLCMADAGTLSLPEPTMAAPRPAPPLAFADDAPMQISLDRAAPMAEHQQEIIVVEEGTPRHMNPPQPHTASANRKREFRQLFAKLRRD